ENDRVRGTDFLTEPTVDALPNMEIIFLAIALFVHYDLYCIIWAYFLTLTAPNASFLAVFMYPSESRAYFRRNIRIFNGYVFTPTQLRELPDRVRSSRCFGRPAEAPRTDSDPAGSTSPAGSRQSRGRTSRARCEASR